MSLIFFLLPFSNVINESSATQRPSPLKLPISASLVPFHANIRFRSPMLSEAFMLNPAVLLIKGFVKFVELVVNIGGTISELSIIFTNLLLLISMVKLAELYPVILTEIL